MCPSFAPVKWLSAHGSDGGVASCRFAPDTAIRFLPRDNGHAELLRREIISHRALRHPHIIAFKKLVLTEEHLCISMDYANAGTLTSMVRAERMRRKEVNLAGYSGQKTRSEPLHTPQYHACMHAEVVHSSNRCLPPHFFHAG